MNLPGNYTQVRHIESSGTQYINTGFKPNNNTRVVMDAQMITLAQPNFFFGARTSSNTVNYSVLLTGSKYRSDYGESKVSSSTAGGTDRVSIDKNKNVCTVNGETITNDSSTFSSSYNLYLFASNDGGTADYFGSMKLYGCQIYNNGTLVRDFIPCKNARGVVGLYDVVNDVFYTDAAGGTFTAGADVIPDYKIVDADRLDGALTATANAIREKTGDTSSILWDEYEGFSSEISDNLGSAVASGTFTISNNNIYKTPVTVSGLSFKPSQIILYYDSNSFTTGGARHLYYCEEGKNSVYRYFASANANADTQGHFSLVINSNGFTLKGLKSGAYANTGTWKYIALR